MCPFINVFFSVGISSSSKHESYTSVAISGVQNCLVESERGCGGWGGPSFRYKYLFTKDDTCRLQDDMSGNYILVLSK